MFALGKQSTQIRPFRSEFQMDPFQRRERYVATGRLAQHESDLLDYFGVLEETTYTESDLSAKHRDNRRLERFRDAQPELDRRIAEDSDFIRAVSKRHEELGPDSVTAKALREDFREIASTGNILLQPVKAVVAKVRKDFAARLGLPMWIVDPAVVKEADNFIRGAQARISTDCFSTSNPDCRDTLLDCGITEHASGNGWQTEDVADCLVQLGSRLRAAQTQCENHRSALQETQQEVEAEQRKVLDAEEKLEQAEDKLEDRTSEIEQLTTRYESAMETNKRAEGVLAKYNQLKEEMATQIQLEDQVEELQATNEDLVEELANARDEVEEKDIKLEELRGEKQDLENESIGGTELLKKNSQLDADLQDAEQQLAAKKAELQDIEIVQERQAAHIEKISEDNLALQDVLRSFLAHVADPVGSTVSIKRMRPFLAKVHALHQVEISKELYTRNQPRLAQWYPDLKQQDATLSLLQLVARGLAIPLPPMDAMTGAVTLEQQLLPGTTNEANAVSIAYNFVLREGSDRRVTGAAFAGLCAVLRALNRRYPLRKPRQWAEALLYMLEQRCASGNSPDSLPLLEQACVYWLCVGMETGFEKVLLYCPRVTARVQSMSAIDEKRANDLLSISHVADLAALLFSDEPPTQPDEGVLKYEEGGIVLVAIRDRTGECLFWRRTDDSDYVLSSAGMVIRIEEHDSPRFAWVVSPSCGGRLPTEAPSFQFRVIADDYGSSLGGYLRKLCPEKVDEAYVAYIEDKIDSLPQLDIDVTMTDV